MRVSETDIPPRENVSYCKETQTVGLEPAERDGMYHKVPKFWDARTLCCNLPKSQTKRGILSKWCKGIANSEDPDQTAPLGAV